MKEDDADSVAIKAVENLSVKVNVGFMVDLLGDASDIVEDDAIHAAGSAVSKRAIETEKYLLLRYSGSVRDIEDIASEGPESDGIDIASACSSNSAVVEIVESFDDLVREIDDTVANNLTANDVASEAADNNKYSLVIKEYVNSMSDDTFKEAVYVTDSNDTDNDANIVEVLGKINNDSNDVNADRKVVDDVVNMTTAVDEMNAVKSRVSCKTNAARNDSDVTQDGKETDNVDESIRETGGAIYYATATEIRSVEKFSKAKGAMLPERKAVDEGISGVNDTKDVVKEFGNVRGRKGSSTARIDRNKRKAMISLLPIVDNIYIDMSGVVETCKDMGSFVSDVSEFDDTAIIGSGCWNPDVEALPCTKQTKEDDYVEMLAPEMWNFEMFHNGTQNLDLGFDFTCFEDTLSGNHLDLNLEGQSEDVIAKNSGIDIVSKEVNIVFVGFGCSNCCFDLLGNVQLFSLTISV